MKPYRRLGLRPPAPRPKPSYDWGVAWFGHNASSGICHRCQRAGHVYTGYNGGAHMGLYCGPCQDPVLRKEP